MQTKTIKEMISTLSTFEKHAYYEIIYYQSLIKKLDEAEIDSSEAKQMLTKLKNGYPEAKKVAELSN